MYYARKSIWKFKKGQREKGLSKMNEMVSNQARTTKGYRGYIQLLSEEDSDSAVIITLWESKDSRTASSKGLFKDAFGAIEQYMENEPDIRIIK